MRTRTWRRSPRRSPSCGAGLERIGGGVVIEHGISPPAAVREPLAVLYHEVHVQQGARTRGIREELVLFRSPVDFGHLGPVRHRLPIAGTAGPVGVNHRRIAE